MSTDHFIKLCAKSKLTVPAKDAEARKLLASAGAHVLDAKGATASALRKEHAAAIVWARCNIDKDAAWNGLPSAARDTLLALYTIKQSYIDKGGKAWIAPCRLLVSANLSPPPSPVGKGRKKPAKGGQISKGARSDESDGSASEEVLEVEEPASSKTKGKTAKAKSPKQKDPKAPSGSTTPSKPYLASNALLAVLPPHRRSQLYLAQSWTTKTRSEREKQLERILQKSEDGGRFEDPETPAWSQRITLRRGPGSAFSDGEVTQDGRNLAGMLRWDSQQLFFARSEWDNIRQAQDRAKRVQAAWDRFKEGGRQHIAPSSAVLAPIFRAIIEVLDRRVASAISELADSGEAGEEILEDMGRQRVEVEDLLQAYEGYLSALFSSESVPYAQAARRSNSVWYGLLHPAVAVLTQDCGDPGKDGLAAQADAAFGSPPPAKKPRPAEGRAKEAPPEEADEPSGQSPPQRWSLPRHRTPSRRQLRLCRTRPGVGTGRLSRDTPLTRSDPRELNSTTRRHRRISRRRRSLHLLQGYGLRHPPRAAASRGLRLPRPRRSRRASWFSSLSRLVWSVLLGDQREFPVALVAWGPVPSRRHTTPGSVRFATQRSLVLPLRASVRGTRPRRTRLPGPAPR